MLGWRYSLKEQLLMQRTLILLVLALGPGVALAQGFPQYPGLSPEQERLRNPIPLPPSAPQPSAPVPMISAPAPVVSTPPPLTVFPSGSGPVVNPVDRRERTLPSANRTLVPAEPTQKSDGSKEIHWQTVTLPPAPDFSRGNSSGGADSMEAAWASIERDGYKQVTGLVRGIDGGWKGKALRGTNQVTVRVDARGNVSAE